MDFCQWLLQQHAVNPGFPSLMLFVDEAGFTWDGIINFCNSHVWSDENPHTNFQSRYQHQFSINLWAGMLGERLISPYVLPQRLTTFLSQLFHQYSARVTGRCPFGKKSTDLVYARWCST
jgi:hypothetical protein